MATTLGLLFWWNVVSRNSTSASKLPSQILNKMQECQQHREQFLDGVLDYLTMASVPYAIYGRLQSKAGAIEHCRWQCCRRLCLSLFSLV